MRRAVVAALVLAAGCSSSTSPPRGPREVITDPSQPANPLAAAINGVTTSRATLLASITQVQQAAKAIDATDRVCMTGSGVDARTSSRVSGPLTTKATTTVAALGERVRRYEVALATLQATRASAPAPVRTALAQAVGSGQAEAKAVAAYEQVVVAAWPRYVTLDFTERNWVHRAVTPWYRSVPEAQDAYSVLRTDSSVAVATAEADLQQASAAVVGPVDAQTAQLAAVNDALRRAGA